jgi:hypothetical protein
VSLLRQWLLHLRLMVYRRIPLRNDVFAIEVCMCLYVCMCGHKRCGAVF